jgi:hypothetical protein
MKMGFFSNLHNKILTEAAIKNQRNALLREEHRLKRSLMFPFTSKTVVEPGLYYIVSYSRIKARGIHRWRMTKGRGHDSFTIDFKWEVIFHQKGVGFTHSLLNGACLLSPTTLIRLTATHADPELPSWEERRSALPIV